MEETIDCFLEGPPWLQSRTRVDLHDQTENDPEVKAVRNGMIMIPVKLMPERC